MVYKSLHAWCVARIKLGSEASCVEGFRNMKQTLSTKMFVTFAVCVFVLSLSVDVSLGKSTGGCISSCASVPNGDYKSCQGCSVYATCSNGYLYDNRPCTAGLVWDDNIKRCEWTSSTCGGDSDDTDSDSNPPNLPSGPNNPSESSDPGDTSHPEDSNNGGCISSCASVPNGDYKSCQGCSVYATCSNGYLYDNRPCTAGLVWDDSKKRCEWTSSTCGGDSDDPDSDSNPPNLPSGPNNPSESNGPGDTSHPEDATVGCVSSCASVPNGDYKSCQGCSVYATCSNGYLYDNRHCSAGLVWDDNIKQCEWTSSTCGGESDNSGDANGSSDVNESDETNESGDTDGSGDTGTSGDDNTDNSEDSGNIGNGAGETDDDDHSGDNDNSGNTDHSGDDDNSSDTHGTDDTDDSSVTDNSDESDASSVTDYSSDSDASSDSDVSSDSSVSNESNDLNDSYDSSNSKSKNSGKSKHSSKSKNTGKSKYSSKSKSSEKSKHSSKSKSSGKSKHSSKSKSSGKSNHSSKSKSPGKSKHSSKSKSNGKSIDSESPKTSATWTESGTSDDSSKSKDSGSSMTSDQSSHSEDSGESNSNSVEGNASCEEVECSSWNFAHAECPVEDKPYVTITLVHQVSDSSCTLGESYGLNDNGMWVDNGCRGSFKACQCSTTETTNCDSWNFRYADCALESPATIAQMSVSYKRSDSDCTAGVSYGINSGGIWVDNGCRAEFEICRCSANTVVDCDSWGFAYAKCSVADPDRILKMAVSDRRSVSECVLGESFGFNENGVWVDKGCRASFDICYN